MRESMDNLNNWAKDNDIVLDKNFKFTPSDVDFVVSANQKGSGKKKRINWRSLF